MTDKEKAMRQAIQQRIDAIDIAIIVGNLSPEDISFYEGKREGLRQAYFLIAEPLDSIVVEL